MFNSRIYKHQRFFVRIFSILLVSLNPSHQCSQLSRQQFPSPKFLSTVTPLCRACGITTPETSRKLAGLYDASLPTVLCLCSRCALLLARMPLTYYSRCVTAQPTMLIWLEDNHTKLLTYLLYTHMGFISC